MKFLAPLLIVSIGFVSSCSSPEEKQAQRDVQAKTQYEENLKQSQETYEDDKLDERREQAKEMIDESDDVQFDEREGKIQVED